ncbi:MAG: hypothetical protein M1570_16725 [Chloroflexi bacterium]|nr:hypothetical protein [Chloroflexota bacterium]
MSAPREPFPVEESVWSNPESMGAPDPAVSAPARHSLRAWMAGLSPTQQLGYGCIGVMMVGALVLYCLGAATLFVRPMVSVRPPTPTNIIHPTLVPTPTQQSVPTFIQLPPGTLVATPTQAPIPTREPPTPTPYPLGTTLTPSPGGRSTSTSSPTATRRP